MKPVWPLGTHFVDTLNRTFEVVHVIMGNVKSGDICYHVECSNDWKISSAAGDHPQTSVGFINKKTKEIAYRSVDQMNEWELNGHVKRI